MSWVKKGRKFDYAKLDAKVALFEQENPRDKDAKVHKASDDGPVPRHGVDVKNVVKPEGGGRGRARSAAGVEAAAAAAAPPGGGADGAVGRCKLPGLKALHPGFKL